MRMDTNASWRLPTSTTPSAGARRRPEGTRPCTWAQDEGGRVEVIGYGTTKHVLRRFQMRDEGGMPCDR